MSKQDEQKKPLPDFVFYHNPQSGLLVLPVIGHLKPGWNKIPRATHLATKREDGTSVIPKGLPISIRDDAATITEKLPEPEAIRNVLNTNDTELLDETLEDEKRATVVKAIKHQKKVITLEEQPSAELERLAKEETRPEVQSMIARAANSAKDSSPK